jgi:CHASE2 domain-containing sensor protein
MHGYQILLNYRATPTQDIAPWVTLTDILNNQVPFNLVNDKIILIGVTDATIKDNFNTPYNQEIRGLMLHAQMVSQILSAVENQRFILWFFPQWGDALSIWFWSLIGGIISWRFRLLLRLGLIGGATVSLYGICFISLLVKGCLLPLVPSLLVLLTTSIVVTVGSQFKAHRQ